MIVESLSEKIEEMARPFLEEIRVELVDLHIGRTHHEIHIQILADKPTGGITLDECSELNRKISDVLEAQNILAAHYVLEVSSPGVDRPLVTVRDFQRVIGRNARFFLSEIVEGKIEHAGIIKRIENDNIVVGCETREIILPVVKIHKAKQII